MAKGTSAISHELATLYVIVGITHYCNQSTKLYIQRDCNISFEFYLPRENDTIAAVVGRSWLRNDDAVLSGRKALI